jgi:hypothetical protein
MYAFEHYEGAIMSMIYIGLVSSGRRKSIFFFARYRKNGNVIARGFVLNADSLIYIFSQISLIGMECVDVYVDETAQSPQGQVKKKKKNAKEKHPVFIIIEHTFFYY